MTPRKKSLFLLLFVLVCFSVGAALFVDDSDMVYEKKETPAENEKEEKVSAEIGNTVAEKDFFTDFRIHREQRRAAAEELYGEILADEGREEAAKEEARVALETLYRESSLEDQVEDILIGRRYADAVFDINETVSVLIIKKEKLDPQETETLISFVSSYAGIPGENLSVFTVN